MVQFSEKKISKKILLIFLSIENTNISIKIICQNRLVYTQLAFYLNLYRTSYSNSFSSFSQKTGSDISCKICMKYQILLSEKNITNLPSGELASRVVKVKENTSWVGHYRYWSENNIQRWFKKASVVGYIATRDLCHLW